MCLYTLSYKCVQEIWLASMHEGSMQSGSCTDRARILGGRGGHALGSCVCWARGSV